MDPPLNLCFSVLQQNGGSRTGLMTYLVSSWEAPQHSLRENSTLESFIREDEPRMQKSETNLRQGKGSVIG